MSSAIRKLLTTDVVEVFDAACKNYNNKNAACHLCIDSCSEEAISFQNHVPTIVAKKCIDCGECVSKCPVNAIDHIQKPYRRVAGYLKDYPDAKITCRQVEEFNRGIKVPCLLYLDAPLLSQYGNKREKLHIYTGHCSACKKVSEEKILSHLMTLESQLELLGVRLQINSTASLLITMNNNQTVDAVSRRDLFKNLSLTKLRDFLLPSSKANPEEATEDLTIEERIVFKRKLVQIQPISIGEVQSVRISFKVNNNCNGCDVCTKICPSKALFWETEDKLSTLTFKGSLCVDCNKCLACPMGALEKNVVNGENYEEKRELISMKESNCHGCQETFKARHEEDTHCYFCKIKKEKVLKPLFTESVFR